MTVARRVAKRYNGPMTTVSNPLALIGNTPLVRLTGPSEATGCDILAKCEFTNPGASVKDRAGACHRRGCGGERCA